jgi:hypothetical protein
MNIPGLKDMRTTLPALAAAVSSFVALYPELFPETELWGVWVRRIAAFIAMGGLATLGVNAASASKVIEKTEERLVEAGLPPKEVPK